MARSVYEADRHAKKRLTKEVRGARKIERCAEGRDGSVAEAVRGYRSALTDDGRPPLEASGLKLRQRLAAVSASLGRAAQKGAPGRVAEAHPTAAGGW